MDHLPERLDHRLRNNMHAETDDVVSSARASC
jgi:hypothetical protein